MKLLNFLKKILFMHILFYNLIKDYNKKNWGLGMGIGDWGLGIGDWAQSPIPNPQSPIPNPQSPFKISII
jgi:hypothetical protein